jgi:hypothetical protein
MEWNDKNVQIITSVNIDFLPSGHNTGRNRYLPVQTSTHAFRHSQLASNRKYNFEIYNITWTK